MSFLLSRKVTVVGRTYRRNDALPDLALEAQIGLAQFGALLTELSDLRTLWEKEVKRVASLDGQRGGGLTDLRTTSKIWENMDSTLETLAPGVGWGPRGETRWREKDMGGERRDVWMGDSDAAY